MDKTPKQDTSQPHSGIFGKIYDHSNIDNLKLINKPYPVNSCVELTIGHSQSHIEQYLELIKNYTNPIIVDFGGGCGINHLIVKEYPSKYYIVETKELCKEALKYPLFIFTSDIFSIQEPIDIFYSNSGIQYALDICSIIDYINTKLIPKHILIQRIFFTDKESYITQQENINTLVWVFNLLDFTNKFTNYTYKVLSEYDFPPYNKIYGYYGEICVQLSVLFTRIS